MFRYIKKHMSSSLVKRAGVRSGLKVSSDADWAGLYTLTGEKRSRSGTLATYDEMPIDWKSGFQQCKGTEYNPELATQYTEDLIATSSAESEVYAAADSSKLALHLMYVCEEMQIPIEDAVPIQVDAGAAMGFIHNTATVGRMKHIDLRESWIDIMRSKKLKYSRVAGTDNPADFFTKIIVGPNLRKVESELMMMAHSN